MTRFGRRPRNDRTEEERRHSRLRPRSTPPPQLLRLLLASAAAVAVALLPTIAEAQKYDALLRQALIASLNIEKAPAGAATLPPHQQPLVVPGSSGVRGASPAAAPAAAASTAADDMVPHYMLDLYRRHRSGLAFKDGTNTIRCLRGKRGSQFRPDLAVFNVASVADPATVVRAELHFTRRKMGAVKEQAFHVTFYDVRDVPSSADMTSTNTLGYSQISRGWQALDITPAVVRSVRRAASDGYQLGITLVPLSGGAAAAAASPPYGSAAATSPFSTYRGDALQSLTKAHHSRPYILVYTNETANVSEDHVYSRMRARGYGGIREETGSMIDPVRGLNQQQQRQRTNDDFDAAKRIFFLRHRRDLNDNEIPGDPDVSRRRMTTAAARPRTTNKTATAGSGAPTAATPTTSFRPKDLAGGGSSSSSSGGRGGGLEQLIPWPRPGKVDGSATGGAAASRCGRRPLVLDFRDIGWDSWIIEPKSFEAAYCSGVCSFPDALNLSPTNHATLQSLLHAVGVRADVPAPCCAPDKLASLTVLYFDPRKNVVLKTYPDMSVESCACR